MAPPQEEQARRRRVQARMQQPGGAIAAAGALPEFRQARAAGRSVRAPRPPPPPPPPRLGARLRTLPPTTLTRRPRPRRGACRQRLRSRAAQRPPARAGTTRAWATPAPARRQPRRLAAVRRGRTRARLRCWMTRKAGVAPLRRCRLRPLRDRAPALHRQGQPLRPRAERQQRSPMLRRFREAVAQQRRLRPQNVNSREAVCFLNKSATR